MILYVSDWLNNYLLNEQFPVKYFGTKSMLWIQENPSKLCMNAVPDTFSEEFRVTRRKCRVYSDSALKNYLYSIFSLQN